MAKHQNSSDDLLTKVDSFFTNRGNILLGVCGVLLLLFGLFLFDAKMSVGGDDSAYIVRAMNFLEKGTFPTFQGALYPLVLSMFVGVFGIQVVLLKIVSFLCTMGWIFMFYKTFKDRLPGVVVAFTMLVVSINSFVLYYASQTYNEAFFLFIEMCFLYYFLNQFDRISKDTESERLSYKTWALPGVWIFLVVITKNAGLSILIAALAYLAWHKRWFSMLYFGGWYFVLSGGYNLFKRIFFATGAGQINRQGSVLMLKDPYNKAKGNEDLYGFVERFIQNSHLYISKHFAKMIGFRDIAVTSTVEIVTYLVIALFLVFLVLAIRNKNRILLFLGLYNGAILGVTFIVLQTRWDQDRLIMLAFPFMIGYFAFGFYELFNLAQLRKAQFLLILFLGGTFFAGLSDTLAKSKKNITVVKRNLGGDKYYGYSADWKNYLEMSEWAAENLPDSSLIMARKPSMAAIFAGTNVFKGLYRIPVTKEEVPTINVDTVNAHIKKIKVTHVIMANLRKNSNVNNGLTINTVRRALAMYSSKNPTGLRLLKTIGSAEKAYLFEFVNEKPKSIQDNIDRLKANVIISPKNTYFSFMLGNAQMNARQFQDAANSYSVAIANAQKEGFEGYFNRGLAYLNSGQNQKAIPDFIKVLEIKPDYSTAYYNLGLAYLNSGDKAKARVAIKTAQQYGFTVAPEILQKIG